MMDPVAACAAGVLVGASVGFFYASRMRRDRDPDWRRSFNHENTNRPSGPPPLRLRRSGDPGSVRPTTPKPEITPVGQQSIRRVYHFNLATIAEYGWPGKGEEDGNL